MIIKRQDLRNMFYLLAAQAVAVLVGLFAFTKIGRQLAVSELGRFGFAISSTVFFGLLAEFGTRYVAMKEIAVTPESCRSVYWHGSKIRWLLVFISLLLLMITAQARPWHSERNLLLLAGLVGVTQFGSDPATWVFFGQSRVDLGAIVLMIDRILYVVGIYVAAWFLPSAEGLLFGALAANFMRMGISAFWAHKRMAIAGSGLVVWDAKLFRRLLLGGSSIGIAIITFVAYSQLTVVLMKVFSSPEALGFYAMAFGIVSIFLVIPNSFTMALFPTLAVKLAEGESARKELVEWVTRLNLVCALPIAGGLLLFPDVILSVWMGARYAASAMMLCVLAMTLIFSALSFMYRLFLFASERYNTETIINIAGILLTVALGIPLCRRYSGIGVAALFVCVEGILTVAKIMATKRWLGSTPFLRILFPGLLAVTIPAIIVTFISSGVRVSIRALFFVAATAILMILFKVIPATLIRTAKEMRDIH